MFFFFLSLLLQCKFANSTLLSLLSFSYFITPYDAQASSAFSALIKLVVALTFLMSVVCSHYQYSFLMFYIIFLFSFFVCLFYFLERKTAKRKRKKKKKKTKKNKERKLNHELNFLYGNLFGPIIFSS